jgi:hypothetical protein
MDRAVMIWTKPNTGQAPSSGNGWPGSGNVRLAACGEKRRSVSLPTGFSPRHLAPRGERLGEEKRFEEKIRAPFILILAG